MCGLHIGFTVRFWRSECDGLEKLHTQENVKCVEILFQIFHVNRVCERLSTRWSIILKSILEKRYIRCDIDENVLSECPVVGVCERNDG